MPRFTKALAAIGAAALIGSLAACSASGDSDTIRIGVVGAADPEWALFTDAAAAEGIAVEVVDFGEYTQPNPATTAGDIDINQFQHIQFLAQYNIDQGEDLQPIGSTAIYPLGLYSDTNEGVESIPDGGKVGIPNDIVNQARGLLVLQSAGLVALEDGGNAYSTVDDVIADESRVEIVPIDADKIGTSMPDLEAAIINNDFLEAAGFEAADAIAEDDPSDPGALPYVNIFATTSDNVDNETYLQLVEIYHASQDVLDAVQEGAGGTAEFLDLPVSDLQTSLTETEEAYSATLG
ncbi:MAG: MetQ/NlpA family ABC transporter substrate-binding protein [Pseudoclavibacter sp.]